MCSPFIANIDKTDDNNLIKLTASMDIKWPNTVNMTTSEVLTLSRSIAGIVVSRRISSCLAESFKLLAVYKW